MGFLDIAMYLFWAWMALIHFDEWWIRRQIRKQDELIREAHYNGTLPAEHPFYGFDNDAHLRKVIIEGLLTDVKLLKSKVSQLESASIKHHSE
jgi:hypothetical protein